MDPHRILDANANRAREALCVMEEAARFLLEDVPLAGELKMLRHDLVAALGPFEPLVSSRDTPGDVGTEIVTPTEGRRDGVDDVVRAAGHRLGEAMRSLEEYGKILDANAACELERLRYRGYAVEQRLRRALDRVRGPGRLPMSWRVCVLLSESACGGRSWEDVAEAIVAARPCAIQVREKHLPPRALWDRVTAVQRLIEAVDPDERPALIVNDRFDVALATGANGVHLGQEDLDARAVRRVVGDRLIIGVSTSALAEAEAALAAGADYCGVGQMFASTTKSREKLAGPAYLREFVDWGRLPHLAIGGITPKNVQEIVAAGGQGVAVSSAVCAAPDPAAVVSSLRAALA